MIVTYYFVGIQFVILTILIFWQTCSLIKIIKVMGNRLAREQTRLRALMIMFAISYIGTSTYYIGQVATDLHCTLKTSCVRFNDFIIRAFVQLFFDILPISYLYYQHWGTSKDSLKQHEAHLEGKESVMTSSSRTHTDQYLSSSNTGTGFQYSREGAEQ